MGIPLVIKWATVVPVKLCTNIKFLLNRYSSGHPKWLAKESDLAPFRTNTVHSFLKFKIILFHLLCNNHDPPSITFVSGVLNGYPTGNKIG